MLYDKLKGARWARRAAWVVMGVLALWALAWLAVPPLLKRALEQSAASALGRPVQVGRVDFSPWSLELTLHDLSVAQAGGGAPQLQVRRIYIDAELQSLLRLAPVVDAVQVDAPQLRIAHLGAGRYDVDDVLARLKAPAAAGPTEPARFALYNLQIRGGSVDYADATVQRTHTLRDLRLGVPFLSNLPSHREIKVQPRLAFVLNGSRFDSVAEGTPFTQTRKTDATLRMTGLDLAPYLGYLPASLPVRLQAALLDADLRVAFEQSPAPAVRLSGSLTARGARLATADAAPLLGFDVLRVQLDDVRPLERVVRIQAVEFAAPRLEMRRNAQGRLNLDMDMDRGGGGGGGAGAPPQPATVSAPQPAWNVSVQRLAIRDGVASLDDRSISPRATFTLAGLTLDAASVQWPPVQPLQFSGSASLVSRPPQASLAFAGLATASAATATVTVSRLALGMAGPYLAQYLQPALAGNLNASASVRWQAAQPTGGAGTTQLLVSSLTLDGLSLADAGSGAGQGVLASVRQLALTDARVDLARSTAHIGKLVVEQPRLAASRDALGRFMAQDWLKPQPAPEAPPGNPWRLTLDSLAVNGGELGWRDAGAGKPVALDLKAVQLRAANLALPAPLQDGATPAKPASLNLSARMASGQAEPGRLSYQGTLGLAPLQVQGAVDAADIPLHALAPYFGNILNLELLRADAAFKGTLRYTSASAGPALQLAGDAALEDLRANSLPGPGTAGFTAGEELLAWTALNLGGLEVSVAPGTATVASVRETALSDFYARLIINEAGRINLQDLGRQGGANAGGTATVTHAAAPPTPPPVIRIGPVSLLNGKVFFSDRFIKPNYSANLSELTGRLGGFSSTQASGAPDMADLVLRGKAEGTAELEITGKLNPLAQPLALDIRGRMRDLELPPLSPYSVKYAGHGIQRGKLSMDVNYVVRPTGSSPPATGWCSTS
ncbi:MAG: DUF748 domain-containing protein [Ramlibacter sp.]